MDKTAYVLTYPARPLVDTRVMKAYSAGRDGPPTTYFLKRSPFSYYYPLEEDMMVDCEVDP